MSQIPDQESLPSSNNGYQNTNGRYFGETPIETNTRPSDEEEIDLRQILALALHNKWWIIAITGVFTIVSIVIALMMTPIYESEGTIIISTPSNRYSMSGSDISSLLMSSYGIGVGSSVDSELEILNSRNIAYSMAKKVLEERFDNRGRIYPILWRAYPKDSSITSADTVARRIMEGKIIGQKGGKLSSILSVKFQSSSATEAWRMVDLIIDTYSEASTSSNRIQAKAALSFLSQELQSVKDEVNQKEEQLRDFMNTTQIVELDTQTKELVQTLARLQSESQVADVKLASATEAIERYKKELEDIKPGISQQFNSSIAPMIQRLQIQLAEFETEKVLLLAKNPILEKKPENEPRLVQLEHQIRIVKEEMAKATKEILESDNMQLLGFLNSSDGGMGARLISIRENLLRLQIEETQFEAQRSILNKQIKQYEVFFDGLPDNMITLARLKRDLLVNEQLYLTLAKQSAEMALWEQTQSGLARIVDTAFLPEWPVKPKKKLVVLIGLILGLALSTGFVFVKEISKKELDSVEKLRKKGYPILSVIPDLEPYINEHFDGKETVDVAGQKISTGLVTLLDSISPSAESYRRLQSNIMYSKPDDPYKVILTTSSNKSEGKTTLSSNLAITMAETGNKVLLIDCDFRRPRIHHMFGVKASPGLVDLLFEDNKDPHEFIHKSVVENVYVLTAGNRPPNPAEINRSKKLRNLISKLRYEFDYIVLDTPPYGIITDAAPLIKLADGVIIVAKFNHTKTGELDHTIDSLKRINANVIGAAMTAFDAKKTSGYYYTDYYYQYSYESYKEYDNRKT